MSNLEIHGSSTGSKAMNGKAILPFGLPNATSAEAWKLLYTGAPASPDELLEQDRV